MSTTITFVFGPPLLFWPCFAPPFVSSWPENSVSDIIKISTSIFISNKSNNVSMSRLRSLLLISLFAVRYLIPGPLCLCPLLPGQVPLRPSKGALGEKFTNLGQMMHKYSKIVQTNSFLLAKSN